LPSGKQAVAGEKGYARQIETGREKELPIDFPARQAYASHPDSGFKAGILVIKPSLGFSRLLRSEQGERNSSNPF